MSLLAQDIRFGFRMLFKNPVVTLVAILALTLGIGANTAIFSVVYAVMLGSLPYKNADQIVVVWEKQPENDQFVDELFDVTGFNAAPQEPGDFSRRQRPAADEQRSLNHL